MGPHADSLDTCGSHLRDRLKFVQQRHIDLQVGQLGRGNGRQSHIVRGGAMGRIVQRLTSGTDGAQESATCAEMRSSFERHKHAGDRALRSACQLRIGQLHRSLTNPRDNRLTRGAQDLLTLVLG